MKIEGESENRGGRVRERRIVIGMRDCDRKGGEQERGGRVREMRDCDRKGGE